MNDWKQFFALPLKPDAYQQQKAERLSLHVEIHSAPAMQDIQLASKLYPLKAVPENNAHSFAGTYEGTSVALDEDFAASWKLDATQADSLNVITYRNPKAALPSPDETAPEKSSKAEPGFFQAEVLVGDGEGSSANTQADNGDPRTVIVLFDNSLSMQWEKLERSYAAMEALLRRLRSQDHFNLLLFNQDVTAFRSQPQTADATAVQQALDFVRASKLRGGTDIGRALSGGPQAMCYRQLCAGAYDRRRLGSRRDCCQCAQDRGQLREGMEKQAAHRPKTNIFAVGDDANLPLLKLLAQNGGVLEHVLSTEPVDYKLDAFLSKIVRSPVGNLALIVRPEGKVSMVYPLDDQVYTRSLASWVGQYAAPAKSIEFHVRATRDGAALDAEAKADFPAQALDHAELPRLWAQARVNALLDQIARDGETRAAIDEIIRLARKYKLVTPYTSFLAAPRALLRPRVIRPGDPVLRVRTDPAIESVIALFPFGLTKPLRHLADEDTPGDNGGRLWETRFLAPTDMKDGSYSVRLILRDDKGNTYREDQDICDCQYSTYGEDTARQQATARRARFALVKARATASTRTLTARLDGVLPVGLHWSQSCRS